jgi:hypothetical protein
MKLENLRALHLSILQIQMMLKKHADSMEKPSLVLTQEAYASILLITDLNRDDSTIETKI